MSWHYIQYQDVRGNDYQAWGAWADDFVGKSGVDWRWDDHAGLYFLCFARIEDVTAFRLKFNVR